MRRFWKRLIREEDAAVATEYVILLGLLAIGIITVVQSIGTSLNNNFQNAANTMGSNIVSSVGS